MKIKELIHQNRRDFKAIFECEFCGNTEEKWVYDDSNFHNNVIPDMECSECKKKSVTVSSQATNPDWMQY